MIIDKLNLRATGFAINHARARRDAHDHLLVQRATDRAFGHFSDQRGGRAEDAAFGAANILAVDKEAIVAPRQFQQRLVDRAQHRQLAFCAAWRILLPLWHFEHVV